VKYFQPSGILNDPLEVAAMATKTVSPPKFGALSKTEQALDGGGDFSRVLAVDSVPDTGLDIAVRASETECAALAQADGLVVVHDLEASFDVRKQSRTGFKVVGSLRARVTQTCIVSLEPFETLINADIDVDFAAPRRPTGQASDPAAFLGGEDPPDPVIDGKIDLGALAAEFLILNLDVYPRKPGVSFEGAEAGGDSPEAKSPFAVLRQRR
jgi:Large ribosomal RNA subunit accumulation protein YceD